MTELSPRARALLAQAKAASSPSAEDAALVLAGINSLATAAGAGAATAAGAGAATSAAVAKGSSLLTLKVALTFTLAVGAGVVTTGVVMKRLDSAKATSATARSSGVVSDVRPRGDAPPLGSGSETPRSDAPERPALLDSEPGAPGVSSPAAPSARAEPSDAPVRAASPGAPAPVAQAAPSGRAESSGAPTPVAQPAPSGRAESSGAPVAPAAPSGRAGSSRAPPPQAAPAGRTEPAGAGNTTLALGGAPSARAETTSAPLPNPLPAPQGEGVSGAPSARGVQGAAPDTFAAQGGPSGQARLDEERTGKPGAASAAGPCALNSELISVRRAQALLATAPRESVSALDAWERQCSTGALTQERLALRALALCAQHELDPGRATLLELRTRFPASPALQRVERACTPP